MGRDQEVCLLLEKYDELLDLRRLHEEGDEPDPRPRMRALAARFPGALRELDALPTAELERRRAEVARIVAAGEAPPSWVRATTRYHALLREALGSRRTASVSRAPGRRISEETLETVAREMGIPVEDARRLVHEARE